MGDWFNVIEDSHYRRSALLAEASRSRRVAVLHDAGIRAEVAALLIKVALWLAPAASPRQAMVPDEHLLPRVARI